MASNVSSVSIPHAVPAMARQTLSATYLYKSDNSDLMDKAMALYLSALSMEAASALALRRVGPAKYEIDGRLVTLRWQDSTCHELLVCEDEVSDKESHETPLPTYLAQAANVATTSRRPHMGLGLSHQQCLTFVDVDMGDAAWEEMLDEEVRRNSMRVACAQAELRQMSSPKKA